MDEEQWIRVKRVVSEALSLEPPKRMKFITEACSEEPKLLNLVQEQLSYIDESEERNFLQNLSDDRQELMNDLSREWTVASGERDMIGKEIGSFRITERLGAGGMGVIYKAERIDGNFQQTVAVKLIKQEVMSEETIHRFRTERNILARLNHPHIARLYDGGITDDGISYLIIEYIKGQPIDVWCNENRCDIKKRLELFRKVCEAVQFAHQNMVIHRDLKPQNILVSNDGQVKILDFGIAKMLKQDHPDHSRSETKPGSRLWTPLFASPEQIMGGDVRIMTDVYALGALLYTLLSGFYPYDFTDKSAYEVETTIVKNDPPAPGKRATDADQTTLRNRGLKDSKQLQRILKGDLDALILKAMRRQPRFRYLSVRELLDDLNRYEADLPLKARQDTLHYRSLKFWKRHKAGLLATVIFAGIIATYVVQITQERNKARIEAQKAQEITGFLIGLFEANKPDIRQGEKITANQLLETGEHKIDQLRNQPEIQSELLEVMGNLYSLLSKYGKADSLLRQSLTVRKRLSDSPSPELASGYYSLAINTEKLGKYDSSKVLLHHAITLQNEVYGAKSLEVAQSLTDLSRMYELDGELDSAYSSIKQAISIYKQHADTLGEGYGKSLYNLAAVLIQKGKYKEAEQVQRASLALSRDLYTPPHSNISMNLDNLARILRRIGKFGEAESLYIQALEMDKKLYGPKHINIAISLNNLANLYFKQGSLDKADSMYSKASQALITILGEQHTSVATVLSNWGNLKLKRQQYEEAERIYNRALDVYIPLVGENHHSVATTYHGLGLVFMRRQQYEEAEKYLRKALQIRQTIYKNEHHHYIGQIKKTLTELMFKTRRYEEAQKWMGESLTAYIKTFGKGHPRVHKIAASFTDLLAQYDTTMSINADSLIAAIADSIK